MMLAPWTFNVLAAVIAPAELTVKLPKAIDELVLPLMVVLAPTLPMVKAFWVAVPMFRAVAVAVSRVGVSMLVSA